jgi:hypothetical protein
VNAPLRIALVLAGIAAAVLLLIALRPGAADVSNEPATGVRATTDAETEGVTEEAGTTGETTQETPEVVRALIVIGADGPSGVQRITARRDQRVILTVQSEIADHVHVHGYDLFADVGPGRPARMRFRADLPGRFEIELEDRHVPIAQLRVDP